MLGLLAGVGAAPDGLNDPGRNGTAWGFIVGGSKTVQVKPNSLIMIEKSRVKGKVLLSKNVCKMSIV